MVAVEDRQGVSVETESGEPEPTFGYIKFAGADESAFTLRCDAAASIAYDYAHIIMVASVAGAESAVKGASAVLQSDTRVEIQPCDMTALHQYRSAKDPTGYVVRKHRLDHNTWHMLAISKRPGLLPVLSDEALWQELRSSRYTTPLLRRWVPWIKQQLMKEKALKPLACFRCSAGILNCDSDTLDMIVSLGIKIGALTVE